MDRWRAKWNRGLEGGRKRDNDDETSAGQNRAIGWIEVKLIGLRELWRVKRGREKERWIKGVCSRWVHPCSSLLTTRFSSKRILRHKRGPEMDRVRWQKARILHLSLIFLSFFMILLEPFWAAVLHTSLHLHPCYSSLSPFFHCSSPSISTTR